MAVMDASVDSLQKIVTALSATLASLGRFESTFSAEAKQTLQASLEACDRATEATSAWAPTSGLAGYLLEGSTSENLKALQLQLQQSLSTILAGGIPIPRSAKEDLSNSRTDLQSLKIHVSVQRKQWSQLKTLYSNATDSNASFDVDVVEAKLDDVVRSIIADVHDGQTSLPEQELHLQLQALKARIEALKAAPAAKGAVEDAAVLSLVVNSLERLHGVRLHSTDDDESLEEEEEAVEEEDDDDDDLFYMPVPSALKLADASKFSVLAKPLTSEAPSPFMIKMEPETPRIGDGGSTTTTATPTEAESPGFTQQDFEPVSQDSPGFTQQDFEPVPEEALAATAAAAAGMGASAMAAAAALQNLSIPSPKGDGPLSPEEQLEQQEQQQSAAATPASVPGNDGGLQVAVPSPSAASPPATSPQPTDEKLKQFVNFLHGENPGACMFHAQMRLSIEGCRKLSNFIKNSGRVRALSLSHNHIGDVGLKILCEGLIVNKSVTSLDLPDNDISDAGIVELTGALLNNTSLTQLQLAYNKIGNDGAKVLAQLIQDSQSLKKLGLSYNKIGKAGCQALTGAISNNQSLKHLQLLPGNPVEEKDAKALAKALKRNKKFSIKSLLGIGDD